MQRLPRPCALEGVDESNPAERQARVRACRCDMCVEARSFVAVNVTHSTRPEITDRICALMWRSP